MRRLIGIQCGLAAAAILALSCSSPRELSVGDELSATYASYVEDLEDAPADVLLLAPADDRAWTGYVSSVEPVTPDTDVDLRSVLLEPVYDRRGTRIAEYKHSQGLRPIAYATCSGRQPVIVYSAEALRRMTEYSFPFVREHEKAHHVAEHVRCSDAANPIPPPRPSQEQNADCEAVRSLQGKGPSGEVLIIVAADRLRASASAGDHLYPPDAERSRYILARCR